MTIAKHNLVTRIYTATVNREIRSIESSGTFTIKGQMSSSTDIIRIMAIGTGNRVIVLTTNYMTYLEFEPSSFLTYFQSTSSSAFRIGNATGFIAYVFNYYNPAVVKIFDWSLDSVHFESPLKTGNLGTDICLDTAV